MDPEISDRIFRRSVELHNMQCTENYGDGESESFSRVQDVYQDSGITVEKNEYIGHVQKRVGTALCKLKRENPGLGGRGKLTEASKLLCNSHLGQGGKLARNEESHPCKSYALCFK